MDKEVDKKFKKVVKSNAMLWAVRDAAVHILVLSIEALRVSPGKKQDRIVGQIADATEEIERLYSSNWH